MPELPRGTVTFLFTDLEGSTRLLRRLGRDRYGEVLREHERLLGEAFDGAGGQVIDTQGDAFFVAFRSAADAVAAAVTAQRAIAAHEWPDVVPVRVRMGIHTGEAAVTTDRYLGLAVHKAARIGAAGHGGQVLLSNTARELVEDELPPNVSLRDLGEQRLKDLERPERLAQLVIAGLPDEFPAPRALEAAPFAGREGELAEAAQAAVAAPRRRRALVAGVVGVLAAAVAVAAVLLAGGGAESAAGASDSVVAIDPQTNEIVVEASVGSNPTAIAFGEGAVWVLNGDDRTISRIDPQTGQVRTFATDATPTGLAAGEGALWVLNGFEDTVSRVDPESTLVAETITLPSRIAGPGSAGAIAVGRESVWVGSADRGFVWRIDPETSDVVETIRAKAGFAIAVGEDAVWVAVVSSQSVWRIDPGRDTLERTILVGGDPSGVAVGFGSVWVANQQTVSRIDSATEKVVETISVAGIPVDVTVGEGRVWVAIG